MDTTLNILAPTRYPWKFNGPRTSRHNISVRSFVPFNKISKKIEGITVFNPFPLKKFDLIHAFNRIPISRTPFIIGYESHLPRAFGGEQSILFCKMRSLLASKKCRAIIAISQYARRQFLHQHTDPRIQDLLESKLIVRYPNLPIPVDWEKFDNKIDAPFRLVFVGAHFGRKGGSVAVRIAKIALERGIPLHIEIISSLEVGNTSWIGPTRVGYWDEDIRLLKSLPNVRYYSSLPNANVIAMVRKAHFSLLPTFSDSFGYSAIESMACGTPVIATKQCALPEFISNGSNGILLDLDTDKFGEWTQVANTDRQSSTYELIFENQVNRLVQDILVKIEYYIKNPELYSSLRACARQTAEKLFSANDASDFWDKFYCDVLF